MGFLSAQLFSNSAFSQASFSDVQDETPESQTDASAVPGEMDAIEQLYKEDSNRRSTEVIDDGKPKALTAPKSDTQLKEVSDLSALSEFRDIAVIQKRYLPKTKRFEGFAGLNGILNDKFFTSLGATGRLSYSFTERYALEALVMVLVTGERDVTSGLRDRGIKTTSFVTPMNYYGVDFKWTPVYGKMGFLNRSITAFDLYFSAGGGMTNTNQNRSEPTMHLGTGQIFALSKSSAFRWDFSWNFYNARTTVGGTKESLYNNLFITFGMSFFFPEATYR